jgi:ATP-dependent Clp protease protease subunit
MTTTEAAPAGAFEDQLSARLLAHQRIVVLPVRSTIRSRTGICAQLLLLSAEDQRRDISLYINSPGGSVSAGWPSTTRCGDPERRQHAGHGHRGEHGPVPAVRRHPRQAYALPHAGS